MRMRRHFLLFSSFALAILIHAQDQSGFISLDCGLPDGSSYNDSTTGITYMSDAPYIQTETGISKKLPDSNPGNQQQILEHVRSFPQGDRNCYMLNLTKATRYLIRTSFMYGNYDAKNAAPEFDLYLGPNLWDTIVFPNSSVVIVKEIIHVLQANRLHVCLINTGKGIPFMSALELRLLKNNTYQTQLDTESLEIFVRQDFGSTSNSTFRFPEDIYDRIWQPYQRNDLGRISSNSSNITSTSNFEPPLLATRTASVPENDSQPLNFSIQDSDPNTQFYFYMYFAELEELQTNQTRQFTMSRKNEPWFPAYSPIYLRAGTVFSSEGEPGGQFSMIRTGASTRPPLINALEAYRVKKFPQLQTAEKDVDAVVNIKSMYGLKKGWQGDPCAPRAYSWEGLGCSYEDSSPPRITTLDLSNNALTGSVPEFLTQLQSLTLLNLKGNALNGSLPAGLIERSNRDLLQVNVEGNRIPCTWESCSKKKTNVIVPVVASVASVSFLLIAFLWYWMKRRTKPSSGIIDERSRRPYQQQNQQLKDRQFTYFDVERITNNFEKVIGKGGFGIVYHGFLGDTQVAVKMLSKLSLQGFKQFDAEVELLLRVHHRNLTSLVGFCDDGINLGLIYEYMANGNLLEYLSDSKCSVLNWRERLEIALEAAQGLEYLHHGCKPPIIHRDVKSTNILLTEKLQAKLSDFGLSKSFPIEGGSCICTVVAGTPGYLDPELTEKSDVYSFGIVLLEIFTNRPVIAVTLDEPIHIGNWVGSMLATGDIESIVDSRLNGDFEINSARKAIAVAMACVSPASSKRPTMNAVVMELNTVQSLQPVIGGQFSMEKTRASTNPPLINALEAYRVKKQLQSQTAEKDVDAVTKIKSMYGLKKNWQGDPCAPQAYSWEGLDCSYEDPNPPRIISLNLSSSGLKGEIAPYIVNLTQLQFLDLSNNNLTGLVPEFLTQLQSLTLLKLEGNALNGSVPARLIDRINKGLLQINVDGNQIPCTWESCTTKKKKKKSAAVPVLAALASVLALIIIALALIWWFKRRKQSGRMGLSSRKPYQQKGLKNRHFTYSDVLKMTNNFEKVLGKGGFGTVYLGHLIDTEVAVKVLSKTSVQGYKQFEAEVELLLRVHHRNLTSLIGYCDDGTNMGLIYEYMAKGDLSEYLSDSSNTSVLNWEGRLGIALEAAQGSYVSTVVAGTPGYLDPEYSTTNRLTEKSDVYSFGVVLLEIITNRPVIARTVDEPTHISSWVGSKLANGDIDSIVDSRLKGEYEINSVWKAIEVAMACLSPASSRRPTMNYVVTELSECLLAEIKRTRGGNIEEIENSEESFAMISMNFDSNISPLASFALAFVIHAQDQSGFISLDCGSPEGTSYTESTTSINYVSDSAYVQSGESHRILPEFRTNMQQQVIYIRSFPEGERNCYTLTLRKGDRYLIRVTFLYGNYDEKNELPAFDVYLGPTFWGSVIISNASVDFSGEMIHVLESNYLQFCLMNTGKGTPFISAFELRLLKNTTYDAGSMAFLERFDVCSTNTRRTFRFNQDVYDRVWWPYQSTAWTQITTTSSIESGTNDYQPPILAMRSACIPANASQPLNFVINSTNPKNQYYVFMHFAEIEMLQANQSREFNIFFNGQYWAGPYSPTYRLSDTLYSPAALSAGLISLQRTENSTLPPILNAVEVYTVKEFLELQTADTEAELVERSKNGLRLSCKMLADSRNTFETVESKKRLFKYSDILRITNNFEKGIGEGGFGKVFHGNLGDTQVAVKMLSTSSAQGYEQFKAEVQLLLRIHHRNLIPLIGYCDDGTNLGLIYEYMAKGNLAEHLSGNGNDILTWEVRLRIALEAAQASIRRPTMNYVVTELAECLSSDIDRTRRSHENKSEELIMGTRNFGSEETPLAR
ncbi:hypothetical protein COLO4_30554 [Corchorus olitorius]|uniref:non-specific serine/threonine protein kinase n=1 Tax=Corchorus olitorius TaxID=93759 RepID=A0A1R3H853_9ROSI|nr:hypothetical protein COLO4_30554 [Corchorus olitorius]